MPSKIIAVHSDADGPDDSFTKAEIIHESAFATNHNKQFPNAFDIITLINHNRSNTPQPMTKTSNTPSPWKTVSSTTSASDAEGIQPHNTNETPTMRKSRQQMPKASNLLTPRKQRSSATPAADAEGIQRPNTSNSEVRNDCEAVEQQQLNTHSNEHLLKNLRPCSIRR